MASKVTLINLSKVDSTITNDLNTNFTRLADAIDDALDRTGASPNQLEDDVDANDYEIVNLGAPQNNSSAARLRDILDEQTSITDIDAVSFTSKLYSDLKGLKPTTLSDGDVRYVRGRSSVGDGGEGHFRWDTNNGNGYATEVGNDEVTAGEGDGGIYVAPDSDKTGASGAWVRQFLGPSNVKWYGAKGDGVTDDAPAFNKALTSANHFGLGSVKFDASPNRYVLEGQIQMRSNVTLEGEGPQSVIEISSNFDTFSAIGSIETDESNTLDSDATFGDLTVTLSSGKGSNFSSGDWILVLSDGSHPVNIQSVQNVGEIAKVKSVSNDTLTLSGPLNFDYTTAEGAEVQRMGVLINPGLKNCRIVNPDPANYTGTIAEWLLCYRPYVSNVQIDTTGNSGFLFQGCIGPRVESCRGIDLKSQTTTPPGFGYFVVEAGPNIGLSMTDCYIERARHAYTTVSGKNVAGVTLTNGVPTGSVISNCTHVFPRAAGFDTHPEGFGISFSNCSVISSEREGFEDRAADTKFSNCVVKGAISEGFQFAKSLRASAINCTAYRTNMGIDPETSSDSTTTGAFEDQGSSTFLQNCKAIECGHDGFRQIDGSTEPPSPYYEGCHAIDIGQKSRGIGFEIQTTESTDVILKNCIAKSISGDMSFGFRISSSNPTCWADGCYSAGDLFGQFDGPWDTVSGSISSGAINSYGSDTTLTISDGEIDIDTAETSSLVINGEGASADDLVTINGGVSGSSIILRGGDANITIKHSTGNIVVEGGADFALNGSFDLAKAVKIGSNWVVQTVAV